jgi:hypothetical protein
MRSKCECYVPVHRPKSLLCIAHFDSSVGIATGRDSVPGRGKRFFSSPQRPDRIWNSLNLLHNGYCGALFPGVDRTECEANHSPPHSTEIKNGRVLYSLLHKS